MSATTTRRALVIDDDAAARGLAVAALELEGWIVDQVEDGAAAIESMLSCPPDLVIVDMMMPRVSGMEVLQAKNDNPRLSRIPAIVYSAREGRLEREMAETFGAVAWLVKPVAHDVLLAAVEDVTSDTSQP